VCEVQEGDEARRKGQRVMLSKKVTPMTFRQFVHRHDVRIESYYGQAELPEDFEGDPWKVVLRMKGRQLTVPFFKGYGHGGAEPTAEEVLHCLAMDALTCEHAWNFEDWAAELGYDPDSRKAEAVYRKVRRQTEKLRRWAGNLYDTLIHCEEES